jgi:GNAT superfamily N-acetyltransferase
MTEIRQWTLLRENADPAVFTGRLIAHSDGLTTLSVLDSVFSRGRYHSLSVFEDQSGGLVLYIIFRSRHAQELNHSEVFRIAALAEVPAACSGYQQVAFPLLAQRLRVPAHRRTGIAMALLKHYQRQVLDLQRQLIHRAAAQPAAEAVAASRAHHADGPRQG